MYITERRETHDKCRLESLQYILQYDKYFKNMTFGVFFLGYIEFWKLCTRCWHLRTEKKSRASLERNAPLTAHKKELCVQNGTKSQKHPATM